MTYDVQERNGAVVACCSICRRPLEAAVGDRAENIQELRAMLADHGWQSALVALNAVVHACPDCRLLRAPCRVVAVEC